MVGFKIDAFALCIEGYVVFSGIVFVQTVHKERAVKSASGQTTVGIDPQVKQFLLCFQLLNLSYNMSTRKISFFCVVFEANGV